MTGAVQRVVEVLTASPSLQALALAVPVAIAVAGLAGWRAKVPHALPLALWGMLLVLWIVLPVGTLPEEVGQFRRMVAGFGWLWLVQAWGRLVLTEWPAPIWAHWIIGTLLLVLPVTVAVVLIRAF